jgi:hypothetical protein
MEKVTRMPRVRYKEITNKELIIATKDGRRQAIKADTIITATSPRLNTGLLADIEGMAPEIYLIGCQDNEPGSILNAIGDSYRLVKAL